MYKKIQLVMLPTNEKANDCHILYFPKTGRLNKRAYSDEELQTGKGLIKLEYITNHLYFLSDEEIKEGDWFLMNNACIRQCKSKNNKPHTIPTIIDTTGGIHHVSVCKKIIATTDKSLKLNYDGKTPITENWNGYLLPQIPQSFIEYYVSEYNKGNIITEVDIEYGVTKNENREFVEFLWVKQDNTINIKPIKDSWNREEVENELMGFFVFMTYGKWKGSDFKKWNGSKSFRVVEEYIKENL